MNNNNVEFKVIEDQRVVVATIKGITFDAINVFNNKFMAHATSSLILEDAWSKTRNQKFYMPYSMKAVARCIPDDEFSVEKGKQIALKKLTEKYNNSLDRHLKHISDSMKKCIDNMDVYLKRHKMI